MIFSLTAACCDLLAAALPHWLLLHFTHVCLFPWTQHRGQLSQSVCVHEWIGSLSLSVGALCMELHLHGFNWKQMAEKWHFIQTQLMKLTLK